MSLAIRPATPADAALIFALIGELADYEKLAHEVKASETDIAELDGAPVGFALWFYNVSTFEGRHGIYLEDLFVRPEARGRGAGLALLRRLAQRCRDEGLARLEWAVLDWNGLAINFYDALGAAAKSDWIIRRLSGEALAALAGP